MPLSSHNKLSILIPVYNERFTIGELIRRVLAVTLPDGMSRELIVVDDCSTDGTPEVLRQLAAQHAEVMKVHFQSVNQGKGAAIRTAIQAATGDICVIQDADLEYDPMDYLRLLPPILSGEADAVFGSRFLSNAQRRVLYFWHSLGNRMLTLLSNIFTDLNLSDMETCYKMVRTDILKSIPLRCNRFGLEPELTAKLAKRGCRIYEVPISYRGRTYAEGKKITWKDGVKALFVILHFWLVDDLYNEQYGHAILHRLSATHRFNRWMADQIKPWVGMSVLEIGAGLGNLSTQLLPRERYVASDIDPLHLTYLKNRFADHPCVQVMTANLESPQDFAPLASQFDTIVCLNVLEHVPGEKTALENMFRALKPGGIAMILVPRGMGLYGTLDTALEHCRRYTGEELAQRCQAVGFDVENIFTFNRVSVLPWYFNGKVLKRRHFGKLQLKVFDSMVWLFRRIDQFLPWQGLSVIAAARRPMASPMEATSLPPIAASSSTEG